jgi:hypothetical protein
MKSSRPTNPLIASAELFIDAPVQVADDQIEFGARLVEKSGTSHRIWFRFPSECSSLLTRRADPFVIATAVYALGRYGRLHVHGTVSEGLFANLADFQAAFAAFHESPLACPVIYSADEFAFPAATPQRVTGITAFSGGVDSCFSAYRHTTLSPLAPKRKIAAALMMHGFDIPLEQPAVFERSALRSRYLTDDAGLRLYTGATNIRILTIPWEDTFGAAVAGSLSFFQPAFSCGLVPSFQEWSQARFDHGSNPLTDPLLSSPSFQIVHDGSGFGRIEKLRHLSNWPGALRHLRVCWQGAQLDRNCCSCEKCLRTMLMLDVCGLAQTEAFPQAITADAVSRLVIKSQSGLDEFRYLLDEAQRLNLQRPWIQAAEVMLKRNRRSRRLWQQGQSIAEFVPLEVRQALRNAGHRWLWKAPHASSAQPVPTKPASIGTR